MVPQHIGEAGRSNSPSSSGLPLFGSQLVDRNSSTPYSDATQVRTGLGLLIATSSHLDTASSSSAPGGVISACESVTRGCRSWWLWPAWALPRTVLRGRTGQSTESHLGAAWRGAAAADTASGFMNSAQSGRPKCALACQLVGRCPRDLPHPPPPPHSPP